MTAPQSAHSPAPVPPSSPAAVAVGVLGALRVMRCGRDVTPTPPKLRQFLALLATAAGEAVRTETIVEELWEAEPTERHQRTIQTYVSLLRKLLLTAPLPGAGGPPVAVAHVPRVGYALRFGPGGVLDLTLFRTLAERSGPDDVQGPAAALGYFRGAPLADVVQGPVLTQRVRLIEADRVEVLDRCLRAQLACGDAADVVARADRIAAEFAQHEDIQAHVVSALARVGRRGAAVEMFHRARRTLEERPGNELGQALWTALREATTDPGPLDPAAVMGPAPATAPLRPVPTPAQVPPAPIPFVGGEAALAAARDGLTTAGTVVVVGGPGSGKTALCRRVAELVSARFPDGQLHVDLRAGDAARDAADAGDPSDARDPVGSALATLVRAVQDGPVPLSSAERVRLFRNAVAGRRLLVVVDGATGGEDLGALAPGPAGALLVAADRRPVVGWDATLVDVPRLRPADQLALFAARVGAERGRSEPAAVRRLLAATAGLPLAVTALAGRVLTRPHWTLQRFADRLDAGGPAPAGGLDELVDGVRRGLDRLGPADRSCAEGIAAGAFSARTFSVAVAAEALVAAADDVEEACERLVEMRFAQPEGGGSTGAGGSRYALDPLYRSVMRQLCSSASAAPAAPPASRSARPIALVETA